MQPIKDFISEIKDRASNPLISSFIISWIFINWKITLALLFYKQSELKIDGYKSYSDLIISNSNFWHTIIIPTLLALVYTFGFPYIKAFVKLLNAKISARNETDILKATAQGYMPVKKYLQLTEALQQSTKELRELIDSQGELTKENLVLNQRNLDVTKKLNEVADELGVLKSKQNERLGTISNIRGYWEYRTEEGGQTIDEKWHITNNEIEVIGVNNRKYTIIDYYIDKVNSTVALYLKQHDYGVGIIFKTLWFNAKDEFKRLEVPHNANSYLKRLK